MSKVKFDWSKWGFWLALTLFFITALLWIYQTYVYEKKPDLRFEIISNEEVLKVNEKVSKLSIRYDQVDLLSENKNISVLIFRFINSGKKSITQNLYDINSPFGFFIKNGVLLSKPTIINSSDSTYFMSLIQGTKNDSVNFQKLIIDTKEYADIKCLVLNQSGIKPQIVPFGKISGIKELKVELFTKKSNGDTIWNFLIGIVAALLASFLSTLTTRLLRYLSKKYKRTNAQQ